MATHEDYTRRQALHVGSDRVFGCVIATAFALWALMPLAAGRPPRWTAGAVAAGILLLALVRPSLLRLANVAWMRFGLALNRITSPVILAIVFYGVMTPMAIALRLTGRDPMRRRRSAAASYWEPRAEYAPMSRQF